MAGQRFLKVIWMYAAGLALIFSGLYMIIFMQALASSGPMGFSLMTVGLLLSMVGGIYGKKKLMETSGEQIPVIEAKQIDQLKQNVVSQLKPPETAPAQSPVVPKPDVKPPTEVNQALPAQTALQQPSQPAPAVQEGIMRILMCPGCNTENPLSNMFCFKCGKRLRAPDKKAKSKSRKKAKKKPTQAA
jgi:hypothetical protein